MSHQFDLTEDQKLLRSSVREFAQKKLRKWALEVEAEGGWVPDEVIELLRAHDLVGVDVPAEYGGLGLDLVSCCIVAEELSREWFSASTYATPMVTGPLIASGSEGQQAKYLPKLVSGEWIGCFALTEADAGSDSARMQSKATPDGDGFIINGRKIFITNAHRARVFLVFCKTRDEAENGRPGITAFLVDRENPGLEIGQQFRTMAHGANPIWEVLLTDCHVSASSVLGEVDRGFDYIRGGFAKTRVLYAARCLGVAQGALSYALDYSKEREQFGRALSRFQAIRFKLADMAIKVEAARQLIHKAASIVEQDQPAAIAIAGMAKVMASESALEVSTEAVQILGGHGFTTEHPVERFFRESKLFQIGEGTDEMQRLIISRELIAAGSPFDW